MVLLAKPFVGQSTRIQILVYGQTNQRTCNPPKAGSDALATPAARRENAPRQSREGYRCGGSAGRRPLGKRASGAYRQGQEVGAPPFLSSQTRAASGGIRAGPSPVAGNGPCHWASSNCRTRRRSSWFSNGLWRKAAPSRSAMPASGSCTPPLSMITGARGLIWRMRRRAS